MTLPGVDALTIEEKIGQMLCLGWGGVGSLLGLNAQARACVQELRAGGMVVMGRNLVSSTKPAPAIDAGGVRATLDELQSLAQIPLFLATDQEGGRVARFGTAPFTRMPTAQTIGEWGDTELARAAAHRVGRELAAVGINWNFAPVADVNSNPANPVIGDRAFGATPEIVSPMVVAQVQGYQEAGILACVKHFPGHGDTALDSHHDLPTVPFDRETMEQRELAPFRAAIRAGVTSVMTAHILFPAVDPSGLPATMSRAILTGLLREGLAFDGLIVTDCLEMRAVSEGWGTARAAVQAAKAGADVLLVCHTWERQVETRDALLAAVRSGDLPIERVDDAVTRILAAKRRLGYPGARRPSLSVIGGAEAETVRRKLSGEDGVGAATLTTLGESAPA